MLLLIAVTAIMGGLLASPMVSFWLVLLTFGFGLMALLIVGLLAIGGPLIVLLFVVLAAFRVLDWREVQVVAALWIAALMLHAGFSLGKSRWGDYASTMGATNQTFAHSFWEPYLVARYGLEGSK